MIVVLYRDGREIARYLKAKTLDDVRQYVNGFGSPGDWRGAITLDIESDDAPMQRFFVTRKGRTTTLLPRGGTP